MRRFAVAATVVAVALVAGGGTAWAWDVASPAVTDAGRERVASAVAAGQDDEQAAVGLADRGTGLAARGLLEGSHTELSSLVAQGQAALDASAGQVADDAVRQRLAVAIAAAEAAVAGSAAPARSAALADELSSATAAVTAAQQEWLTAKAAEDAAKAAAEVRSCGTTYSGPTFWTSVPEADGDGTNGKLPASAMAPLSWSTDSEGNGYWLVTDATSALERLNVAFRAQFGHDLDIDLAYRDYQTQVEMKTALGSIAATPGQSPHGWGRAFDVPEWPCKYGYDTPQRDWLVAHGPEYGWYELPSEYWHFDYKG